MPLHSPPSQWDSPGYTRGIIYQVMISPELFLLVCIFTTYQVTDHLLDCAAGCWPWDSSGLAYTSGRHLGLCSWCWDPPPGSLSSCGSAFTLGGLYRGVAPSAPPGHTTPENLVISLAACVQLKKRKIKIRIPPRNID